MENETLKRMGRATMSREVHLQTWGRPLFSAILDRSPGIDLQEFRDAYTPIIGEFTEQGKLDVIPEPNLRALDKLAEMSIVLTILTSREQSEMEHILQLDHHLATRIKKFYYKNNMKHHKPDKRAFDHLLEEFHLQPSECMYVGDSLSDAQAAKEAGLHFVASLESGLRQKEDFVAHPPDAFIMEFPEIIPIVERLQETP